MTRILYLPFLNHYTGSLVGSLLLVQCCYWYKQCGRPFYKFIVACSHFLYRPGESWTEELGITKHVWNSTRDKIATKIKKGNFYNLLECGWILYYTDGNNTTYYVPNYPKMLLIDFPEDALKRPFSDFRDWKIKNPNSEKWNREIRITDLGNTNFGFPYKQNTTQSTNSNNTQKDISAQFEIINTDDFKKEKSSAQKEKIILPFDTPRFQKMWQGWKDYRSEDHGFRYSFKSEMAALMPLGDYTEDFAIKLIQTAISKNWKGFHFENTPIKFKDYVQSNRNNSGQKFESHVESLL